MHHSSVSWEIIFLCFFIENFICFRQKEPIKVQSFRLSTARMKINKIPYVIFQSTSQFSFKFYITFQYHDTKFFWNFLAELLHFEHKKPHQSINFETFACFNESSPNSSCQFWNNKVKVYSNFPSLFSAIKDNSFVFF